MSRLNSRGMSGHHRAYEGKSDEWLTPLELIKKLGEFDLDPCCPISPPWTLASVNYNKNDDGLSKDWFGRVWLNPPYGPHEIKWIKKLADHGNGLALIFARTETEKFFSQVWDRADAILFIKGRLYFYDINGDKAKANSGAPSCLVAYGENNAKCLETCGISGKFIRLNYHD